MQEKAVPIREAFPANKPQETHQAKKKVVTNPVSQKKPSKSQKVKDAFFAEDAQSVTSYILYDVLIPSIKTAIADTICNGIDMLFGRTPKTRGSAFSGDRTYVSYDNFSRRDRSENLSGRRRRTVDDIVFQTRADAEAVLSEVDDIIRVYGFASFADFLDLCGKTSEYTDDKWGWDNVRTARVIRDRASSGYILDMPRMIRE